MLIRLLYAGGSSKAIEPSVNESNPSQSPEHDSELGITAILCQGGDYFPQVRAGGRELVDRMHNEIVQDGRHHDVVLMQLEEVTGRRIAGWALARANLARVNPSPVLQCCIWCLDPHAISGRAATALLKERIAPAQIIGRGPYGTQGTRC